jgi:hypothetical protein
MIVMPCTRRLLSKLYPSESYVSVEHVNCGDDVASIGIYDVEIVVACVTELYPSPV